MIGSPEEVETAPIMLFISPSLPAFNIAIAGIIVVKIPAKSFATSWIGNHVNWFSFLIFLEVKGINGSEIIDKIVKLVEEKTKE